MVVYWEEVLCNNGEVLVLVDGKECVEAQYVSSSFYWVQIDCVLHPVDFNLLFFNREQP